MGLHLTIILQTTNLEKDEKSFFNDSYGHSNDCMQ